MGPLAPSSLARLQPCPCSSSLLLLLLHSSSPHDCPTFATRPGLGTELNTTTTPVKPEKRIQDAEVFLRLLRCLPHPRLDERAQSTQQRSQPPTQCHRLLPTDRPRESPISHRLHHLLLRRRGPGPQQPDAAPEPARRRRLPARGHALPPALPRGHPAARVPSPARRQRSGWTLRARRTATRQLSLPAACPPGLQQRVPAVPSAAGWCCWRSRRAEHAASADPSTWCRWRAAVPGPRWPAVPSSWFWGCWCTAKLPVPASWWVSWGRAAFQSCWGTTSSGASRRRGKMMMQRWFRVR